MNVQMETGATPLYLACQNGNLETVEHLVRVGNASVKILTYDGMSCMHAAAQSGHLTIVQYLVSLQYLYHSVCIVKLFRKTFKEKENLRISLKYLTIVQYLVSLQWLCNFAHVTNVFRKVVKEKIKKF